MQREHLRPTNDSWRVDETYIEVKGNGSTCTERWIRRATPWTFLPPNRMPRLQFGSSAKCSTPLILRLPVSSTWTRMQRIPKLLTASKLRRCYQRLRNVDKISFEQPGEQDHRFIKRLVQSRYGVRLLQHGTGVHCRAMKRWIWFVVKLLGVEKGDIMSGRMMYQIFGVAA